MPEQSFFAACGQDHGEAGCPPAAHRGPWWSRYPPRSVEDPTPEQVDAPEGGCDPMGSLVLEQAPARTCGPMDGGAYTGAGLLAGLVTPWGTHPGAACS